MTSFVLDDSINQQWCVARRPTGNVVLADFEYQEAPIPTCQTGQILLKTLYLNLAPVMRMYMSGKEITGEQSLGIGDLIHGRGVAQVIESKHPDFDQGDIIQGQLGWQTFKVSNVTDNERIAKIPERGISYGLSLGPLGMSGFSAYFGFFDRGLPEKGDTVVVSAAAGGVGSMVIQLAKIQGCRVIGIAGGQTKCRAIALWCDATIDYKTQNLAKALDELAPNGLDIYFDNVGGETLSICLDRLAQNARIVLCGSISEYLLDQPFGPVNYTKLRKVNGSMNGFFVYNHAAEFASAEAKMAQWIKEDKLKPLVHLIEGFENMPDGLAQLYSHKNIGTAYCRIREIQ